MPMELDGRLRCVEEPEGVGPGHKLYFLAGIWYCRHCGAWFEGKPKKKAALPCRKPTAARRLVVQRAEAGNHPEVNGKWPIQRIIGDCIEL